MREAAGNLVSGLGLVLSRVFARTAPDPFVLAVLLSAAVAVLAVAFGTFPALAERGAAPEGIVAKSAALLDAWRGPGGIWAFLRFSMQMALILVTGHALAASRPVRAVLGRLADLPRSTASAAAMVALVACLASLLNWGLCLIVGALLARDVGRSLARRGISAHYPLIAAAGYTGMMVWHGGLSGSAPVSMTTATGAASVVPAQYLAMLPDGRVPLSETIFSPLNLVTTAGLIVIVPVVAALLAPRRGADIVPMAAVSAAAQRESDERVARYLPGWMERTPLLAVLIALPLLAAFGRKIAVSGAFAIDLDDVNTLMLGLGLLLHGSLGSYARAAEEAARGAAGIIVQFPLYAGIMAMMVASGLARSVAGGISAAATPEKLPVLTFFSAAGLNLVIPSGGGQWGVQAPIVLGSAFEQGVDPGRMIMAVAYGDQLTNMLQPFWALPLLAITGVRAKDIVGYTAVVMLAGAAWITLCLLVF